ncbi:hypothetical protein ACOME3_002129 [Neoechinorhynchus agilis]
MLCPDSEIPTLDINNLTFDLMDFRRLSDLETALKVEVKEHCPLGSFDDAVALFDSVNLFMDKVPEDNIHWIRCLSIPLIEELLEPIKDQIRPLLEECLKTIESGVPLTNRIRLTRRFVEMCFRLKMFDRLVEPVITDISNAYVIDSIDRCDPKEDTKRRLKEDKVLDKVLEAAEQWVNRQFKKFLFIIVPSTPQARQQASQISAGLLLSIKRAFVHRRCESIFNLIRDYPATGGSIRELCRALRSSCMTLPNDFVEKLISAIHTRLLIRGIPTEDILQFFVSAVKILGMVDSSGSVRDKVYNVIKTYLKKQGDTVKAIISSMTSEEGMDMWARDPNDEQSLREWEDWLPEPLEAYQLPLHYSRKTDMLTILVGIYDSPSAFVAEYQRVLSSRILSRSPELESLRCQEERYIRILGQKFGEQEVHDCKIMMSDIGRSVAFNIRDLRMPIDAQALIFSFKYWPEVILREAIILPEIFVQFFLMVRERFKASNPDQTLDFFHDHEIVDIELEFENSKTVELTVTLLEALVLMKFQETTHWFASKLAEALHISAACIRQIMAFWLKTGLFFEGGRGDYLLVEDDFKDSPEIHRTCFEAYLEPKIELDDGEDVAIKRRTKYAKLCWHYVTTVLRYSEGVGIERLFSIIKTHAMQFSKDIHLHDIRGIIDEKLATGELVCVDNVYKLSSQTLGDARR